MSKYECERDEEVRGFDSFEECRRFVLREGDQSRLWSYVGRAAAVYGLGFEPTPAQVREHFAEETASREREYRYRDNAALHGNNSWRGDE